MSATQASLRRGASTAERSQGMKGRQKRKSSSKKKDTLAQRMKKKAMKQPGVREAMVVHGKWQQIEKEVRPYRQAMTGRKVVFMSNSSAPKRKQSR